MTPGERITAKREIATLLSQQEWSDIDLTLTEHGQPTSNNASGGKYDYVLDMLHSIDDKDLRALHSFLVNSVVAITPGSDPWKPDRFRLFMSHLAKHEEFVGKVSAYLDGWGVSSFVAHVSIEPSKEWLETIETALLTCDGMAVFLHDGFKESNWCDQEVGYAMARKVPVYPLAMGVLPYGFMGKLQAARCGRLTAVQIGERLLDLIVRTPSAQSAITEGMVGAFERAYSFDRARAVYTRLHALPSFTPDQLVRLDAASRDNGQVRDANLGPDRIANLVQALITARGGMPTPQPDPWDTVASDPWSASKTEPPF